MCIFLGQLLNLYGAIHFSGHLGWARSSSWKLVISWSMRGSTILIGWTYGNLRYISMTSQWTNMYYDMSQQFKSSNAKFKGNNGLPTGTQLLCFIRNVIHHFGISYPFLFSSKQQVYGYFDSIFPNLKFEVHDIIFKNHKSIRAHPNLAKYR